MEPRVYNLLLNERLPPDRHGAENHGTSNSSGAVYPSATLPAIRLLHEDQSFDSRPYTNEINSLTLPEIDWQALTTTASHHPPTADATVSHVVAHQEQPVPQAKRPTKSGAPLAEVLNQASPVARNAPHPEEFPEPEARKRRRLDEPAAVTRTLPRPSPAAQKGNKRQPFLPPLLVPLHEPPPDAGLIPSMTTDGFRERMDRIPSREALREITRAVTPPPLPAPSESQEKVDEQKNAKNRRTRHNWSEEETGDLLRGVAKFGIGSWKKILEHPEYKFSDRTAVDLKDRFRTCCPEEYRKAGTEQGLPEETVTSQSASKSTSKAKAKPASASRDPESSNKFEHKLPDELARLGISGPFPKAQRRARRGFTDEEDEAILRGFEKYGAKWTKIQSDLSLGLSSRSRTDLRDRFRNKFPEKFIQTGHKFKVMAGISDNVKDGSASETNHVDPFDLIQPPSSSALQSATQSLTNVAISESSAYQSLPPRLLTAPLFDGSHYTDFGDMAPDNEDHGTITLSRNILNWTAISSAAAAAAATRHEHTAHGAELSSTVSTMDQLYMNPMLALKTSQQQPSSGQRDSTTAGPSNFFPQLPLSGILNGPISLPPPADLVSGVEVESRQDH